MIASRARLAARGVAAGAAMGLLVGGVGGRITMRLIALGQHRQPFFTWSGSLTVVFVATLIGALAGAPYPFVRPWLPGRGVARGLVYSLALQLVGLVIGFPLPFFSLLGRYTWPDVLPRLALSALIFVGGATLELVFARLDRRVEPGP